MYGYVRPHRGELRVREYRQFRAAYCGLCQTLRERYGAPARFIVNYDLTFLAMALSADAQTRLCRCPVHPVRKCSCVCPGEALSAAADYSVILAWWKLRDGAQDEKAAAALAARAGLGFLRGAYKKAAAARPDFDGNARACLAELAALEKEKSPSLDRTADCFARILSCAAENAPDGEQRRVLRELLYHVGRIVYILDAVDDLKEDILKDRYNPLRCRGVGPDAEPDGEQLREVRATLNLSQRAAAAALGLRSADAWQPILENVVTVGLPEVTGLVFSGEWNDRKKNGRAPELLPEGVQKI